MYRIFIADDENWILERLVQTVNWESIDVKVVGKATNGKEALQLISNRDIDILITDIRMPEIDGIELIREAKKYQISMKSIIISGYSDFEYARQAISEGVYDYLTKPVEDTELLNKVQNCCKELEKERTMIKRASEKRDMDRKSEDMIRKQYLNKLLSGIRQDEITSGELRKAGIDDSLSNYICMGIAFDKIEDSDISLNMFITENILNDLCKEHGKSYCVQKESDILMCIIGIEEAQNMNNKLIAIAEELRSLMNVKLNVNISIGLGQFCDSIYQIYYSKEKANIALQNRFFFGGNTVYNCEKKIVIPPGDKLEYEDVTHIVNHVKMGLEEKSLEECAFYVKRLKFSNSRIQPIDLKIIFQNFIFTLAEKCFNSEKTRRSIYNSDYFQKIHNIHNFETLEAAMKESISFLCRTILIPSQEAKKQTIDAVIQYIKKHYGEKITLDDVAGLVYLNTSYFCKIFKEEMGESFVHYLIRYRMKKASEFLEDFSLKIYEVAELVGYNDIQYFTKIYKKVNGISPKEYRTNLIAKGN